MANLVSGPYLHSKKWTFYNNVASEVVQITPNKGEGVIPQKLIELTRVLEEQLATLEDREHKFYNDFGVSNNVEWAQKYLKTKQGEGTDNQKILSVINSREMIGILSSGNRNLTKLKEQESEFIKRIEEMLPSSDIPSSIIEEILNKAIIMHNSGSATNFTDFMQQVFNTKGNITANQKKLITKLLKDGGVVNASGNTPLVQKINSKYIQKMSRQLTSKSKTVSVQEKINLSIAFLKEKLTGQIIDEKLTKLIAIWKDILVKDAAKGNARDLTANTISNVIGEVSEMGEVIAYMDFDNSKKQKDNINITVTQHGKELVDRLGNIVKSKIDTVWTGKSGTQYFIQNKNSIQEIYAQFDITRQLESLPEKIPSHIPLQKEAKMTLLLNKMSQAGIFDLDDCEAISYLLVNYAVLNKYEGIIQKKDGPKKTQKLYKSSNNKENAGGATQTQAIIDMIMAKGIRYFLGDLLPSEKGIKIHNVDFIIFQDNWLLPLSLLVKQMILFINDYKNAIMRLYTKSSFKGGLSASEFEQMEEEKQAARIKDTDPENKNYHLQEMVDAGVKRGKQALVGITFGVSLKFKTRNLVEKALL